MLVRERGYQGAPWREADFRPARKAHPAFRVANLVILAKRLAEAGFPVAEDEPLADFDRCYVDDPFGNRIELMEARGQSGSA